MTLDRSPHSNSVSTDGCSMNNRTHTQNTLSNQPQIIRGFGSGVRGVEVGGWGNLTKKIFEIFFVFVQTCACVQHDLTALIGFPVLCSAVYQACADKFY